MAAAKKDTSEAIYAMAADDDLADILAMSDDEIDAELRAKGGDPDAIAARGAAHAANAAERQARLAWQRVAQERLEAAWAKHAERPKTPADLPRAELVARIKAAQNDPRLSAPLAAAFRKRTAEESTEDELRALLDEIDLLAALDDD